MEYKPDRRHTLPCSTTPAESSESLEAKRKPAQTIVIVLVGAWMC